MDHVLPSSVAVVVVVKQAIQHLLKYDVKDWKTNTVGDLYNWCVNNTEKDATVELFAQGDSERQATMHNMKKPLINHFECAFWVAAVDLAPSLIHLTVRTLTGASISVHVDPTMPVLSIKRQVHRLEGIPIDQGTMIFAGKLLEDTKRIDSYKIENGSTIHLVLRLSGGGGDTDDESRVFSSLQTRSIMCLTSHFRQLKPQLYIKSKPVLHNGFIHNANDRNEETQGNR